MERCGGNNGGQKLDKVASTVAAVVAGVTQPETMNVDATATAEVVTENVPMKDPEMCMPLANVTRIMRKILPIHVKISDDAKETVQECVSEFIAFVTLSANEHCHREQRKTVIADDIIWALGKLGFEQYNGPLSLFHYRYREFEADRGIARGDPMMGRNMNLMVSPLISPPQGPIGNGPFMPQVHMGMMEQQQPPLPPAFYGGPMGSNFMDGDQFNLNLNSNPNMPMINPALYPMNSTPAQNSNPAHNLNPRRYHPYRP
ncbi:hypothetical protein GIB67_001008 [Kingdonia uniflora]|uniref:Transcription factor CBF/NF-Y/archaeal histone domain-containing protein n=1 Tax=Kingdonia uniflora TaxID=39325 RepID=A0A7J7MFU1_9MAGN|nr:hypothetical protein GIB67_001008 [Kingdonia uniflora]